MEIQPPSSQWLLSGRQAGKGYGAYPQLAHCRKLQDFRREKS